MTETFRFFDLHGYTESDFAEVLHRFRRDGVLSDVANKLAVTVGGGFATVASGEAFVQGFWYKNDAPLALAIANNASATVRNDLVVLRLDRTANTMTAAIHQGVVDGSITLPTQIAGAVWEFVLATISTSSGVSTVVDGRTYSQQVADGNEIGGTVSTTPSSGTPQQILAIDTSTKAITLKPATPQVNGFDNPRFFVNLAGAGAITATGRLCDRWRATIAPPNAFVGQLYGAAPPLLAAGGAFPLSVRFQRGSVALGANDITSLQFGHEGQAWRMFVAQPFVISWWAYSSKAGTFSLSVRSTGGDRGYYHPYSMPANLWQFNWWAFPAAPSSNWGDLAIEQATIIDFGVYVGSTYQSSTPDVWTNDAGKVGTTTMTNPLTASGDQFYICAPKLELGYYPTPWMPVDYVQDELRCKRFYLEIGAPGAGDVIIRGLATAGTQDFDRSFEFPVTMRGIPAISYVGTWNTANITYPAFPVAANISAKGFRGEIRSNAAGDTYAYNAGANARITCNAEYW